MACLNTAAWEANDFGIGLFIPLYFSCPDQTYRAILVLNLDKGPNHKKWTECSLSLLIKSYP